MDEQYLSSLQEKFDQVKDDFCGYGVATSAFHHQIQIGVERIPIFKKKVFMTTLGFMIHQISSISKKVLIYQV